MPRWSACACSPVRYALRARVSPIATLVGTAIASAATRHAKSCNGSSHQTCKPRELTAGPSFNRALECSMSSFVRANSIAGSDSGAHTHGATAAIAATRVPATRVAGSAPRELIASSLCEISSSHTDGNGGPERPSREASEGTRPRACSPDNASQSTRPWTPFRPAALVTSSAPSGDARRSPS